MARPKKFPESEQFHLRLPTPLLRQIEAAAAREHRTVTGQMLHYLELGMAADNKVAPRE